MKNFLIGLLVGLALLPTAQALELKTERYTLKNGLTVLLHEDTRTPKVTVNFLVKVGSKDELANRSGFAHLFEHLMFMGTKRVPQGEYDKIIESYGGDNNAFTAPDMTLYYSSACAVGSKAKPTSNPIQSLFTTHSVLKNAHDDVNFAMKLETEPVDNSEIAPRVVRLSADEFPQIAGF